MFRSVRLLLVLLMLGFVTTTPASAGGRATVPETTRSEMPRSKASGDADLGVLWIVAGVAGIVFFIWVCAKVGDTRSADGMMN